MKTYKHLTRTSTVARVQTFASARHTRVYLTTRFPLEARTKCLGSLRLAFLLAISAHLDMLEICFA